MGYFSAPILAEALKIACPENEALYVQPFDPNKQGTNVLTILENLDVYPDRVWPDNVEKLKRELQNIVWLLYDEGKVSIEEREVYTSKNGKICILNIPCNLDPKIINRRRKTQYQVDREGNPYDKETGERLHSEIIDTLILQLPEMPLHCKPSVNPDYASREYEQMCRSFSGRRILISRVNRTHTAIKIEGKDFFLDNDLIWMIYLANLAKEGISIHTQIAGCRTLKQVVLSHMLSDLLQSPLPHNIITLPYVRLQFSRRSNTKEEDLFLQEIMLRGGNWGKAIKATMLLAFGKTSKNLAIPSGIVYRLHSAIERLSISPEIFSGSVSLSEALALGKLHVTVNQVEEDIKKIERGEICSISNYTKFLMQYVLKTPRSN